MGFQFERDNKDNFVFIPPFHFVSPLLFSFIVILAQSLVMLLSVFSLLISSSQVKEFFKLLEHVHKNWPQTIFGNMLSQMIHCCCIIFFGGSFNDYFSVFLLFFFSRKRSNSQPFTSHHFPGCYSPLPNSELS
mgnify:CR=1 FL=1